MLDELVGALQEDGHHARAVAVLEEHEPALRWMHRFRYVYNVLIAGFGRGLASRALRAPGSQEWLSSMACGWGFLLLSRLVILCFDRSF